MLFPNRCRVFHWFCFLPQLTPIPLHMSLLLLYLNKKKQSPGISVFTGFVSGSVIFSVNFNKAVTVTVNFSVTLTVAVTVTVVVAVFVNVTVTFAVAVSANVNVTVAVKLEATVTVTFTDVVLVTVNNRVTPSATIRAPTFFTGRRNLLQSVGCADANWDLFSLIFVVLFLVRHDNSFRHLRWIHILVYTAQGDFRCPPVKLVHVVLQRVTHLVYQKPRVVDINRGRTFPRIVGTRWYLIMSFLETSKTNHLQPQVWNMDGLNSTFVGWLSGISSWEFRRFVIFFDTSNSLHVIPLVLELHFFHARNGFSLLLEWQQHWFEANRGQQWLDPLFQSPKFNWGPQSMPCYSLTFEFLSRSTSVWMILLSAIYISMSFYLACLDYGALITSTTFVMTFVLLLQWWWKRTSVEVWLWCVSFRGYLLYPLFCKGADRRVLLVCHFSNSGHSCGWSACSPNWTLWSQLVSAIRHLVWLLGVYPQQLVLYFYLAALPLLVLHPTLISIHALTLLGFLAFLLCIMGINAIVITYAINK